MDDIFAKLDASSEIKNNSSYTDRLNPGGLQVGRWYIVKYYGREYEEIIPMR